MSDCEEEVAETMELWDFGTLGLWNFGTLELRQSWNCELCLGTLRGTLEF